MQFLDGTKRQTHRPKRNADLNNLTSSDINLKDTHSVQIWSQPVNWVCSKKRRSHNFKVKKEA
jgi:hypothetical protein